MPSGEETLTKRLSLPALAAGLVVAATTLSGAGRAQAQQTPYDPALLVVGAGGYDVFHDKPAGVFRGEYRFGQRFFYIRPILGVEANTDGGFYGYGGFGVNLPLTDHIVLFPSLAVGAWTRGDSKNLGAHFPEYRTGAELAYRFDDASRIGVTFHHISNAGATQRNPGVEEALIEYAIPLGNMFP
jgi:hypothetical protein